MASALPLALKATFLCFPMVSSLAFRTFHLDCLDNGRAYLVADYSLDCGTCDVATRELLEPSAAYERVRTLAYVAILLFPFGVPFFYLVLLLRNGDDEAKAFARWALSLALDESFGPVIAERDGVSPLVDSLRSRTVVAVEQSAAALAKLAAANDDSARDFLEPLGLYMTSECGQFAKVELPSLESRFSSSSGSGSNSGGGSLSVTFAAAAECDKFRLKLTKTARARPGSGFAVAHAPLVRGAYEIAPAAGGGATVVTVTYGN